MGYDDSRRIMAGEQAVARYVPYSHHVTNSIIATKNGEYLVVWKITGRSHQAVDEADLFVWLRELNNMIRGLGESICLWSHVVRRRVREYPAAEFANPFCRALDDRYRNTFDASSLMVNDLYLTAVQRPVSDRVLSFFARRERPTPEQLAARSEAAITELRAASRTIDQTLTRYGARALSIYTHNGHAFSEPAEFLARLINGHEQRIPVTRDRLCDTMPTARPFFSTWGELGELRSVSGSRKFGMLEIREYDEATEPGHLNGLLEAPYECVLSQSFSPLSRHASVGLLRRQQEHLIGVGDKARSQIAAISEAMDQIVSGHVVMGEHHATLLIYGDTGDQVRDSMSKATTALQDVGIMPKAVDLALEAGYWAQLPANWRYRPRPAPITSNNFLSFSSLHNFMSGKPAGNPWGPAVTIFKSVAGTPLYFNFHATDAADATDTRPLGNTILVGQSGSGKTVLLGFLLAQSQKFSPTAVVFDKDRGMEVAVRAMCGQYLPLAVGAPSGFNPLQMAPTSANIMFLGQLVRKLVGGEITTRDEQEIARALDTVMLRMDRPARRLSTLLQSLPNPVSDDPNARPTVHARLRKWCEGGEFGWLFDNATDALDLSTHRLYGFDLTEFLEQPDIRSPLVMYLLHRTESMIDGRRFMYVFDEFWKALSDDAFEDLAKNKMLTIRKQNGLFVFCTQEPGAVLDSPIAKTLVQQCATQIFLPNPKADHDDYVQGFKLTESEFELVRNLGETSRRFLIKQAGNSALAELDLGGFDDELLILSGTPDRSVIAEAAIAEVGDDPALWLPRFLTLARSAS